MNDNNVPEKEVKICVLFDHYEPDYWKDAANLWLLIWKHSIGPWNILSKDIAYIIARYIYYTYQPPFGSWLSYSHDLMQKTDEFYKNYFPDKPKKEENKDQLTIRRGYPHWEWRGVGTMGVPCRYCFRPLGRTTTRLWNVCYIHGTGDHLAVDMPKILPTILPRKFE